MEKGATRRRAAVVAKKPATATATAKAKSQKRAGTKWIGDHWKLRRALNLPAPLSQDPPEVSHVIEQNAMISREADLHRILREDG